MRGRLLPPVALVALLLLAGVGVAGWAYAHRGYPDVVYYQEEVVTDSAGNPPFVLRGWTDPQGGRDLTQSVRAGLYGESVSGWLMERPGDPGWPQALRSFQTLLHGGFSGLGRALLAQAHRPARHLAWSGRPALLFTITATPLGRPVLQFPMTAPWVRQTVWLDARSMVPFLRQTVGLPPGATVVTYRYTTLKRYLPGSLPADLFDPPNPHPTLWDKALGWVRGHLGGPSRP